MTTHGCLQIHHYVGKQRLRNVSLKTIFSSIPYRKDKLKRAQTWNWHINTSEGKHCSDSYVKAFYRDTKWLRAICYSHSLSSENRLRDGSQQCIAFISCALSGINSAHLTVPATSHALTDTHTRRKGKRVLFNPHQNNVHPRSYDSNSLYAINLRSDRAETVYLLETHI